MDLELLSHLDTIGLVPLLLWLHYSGVKDRKEIQNRAEEERAKAAERHVQMARGWEKQLADLNERADTQTERVRDRWTKIVEKVESEKKEQSDKTLEEIRSLSVKIEDAIRFFTTRGN